MPPLTGNTFDVIPYGMTNPIPSSAGMDSAKIHAGIPDVDCIRNQSSVHSTPFAGMSDFACWRSGGMDSAWASVPAAHRTASATTSITVFLTGNLRMCCT